MEAPFAPAETDPIPVLVIEDNTGMSDLLTSLLKKKGCQCHVERIGHFALETAKHIQPALIICDIKLLSNMSGLEVARSIRADPDMAHIPLVALSGNSSGQDRQRALDAGFDLFFPKPFPFIEFSHAIDGYLTAHREASYGQHPNGRLGQETDTPEDNHRR